MTKLFTLLQHIHLIHYQPTSALNNNTPKMVYQIIIPMFNIDFDECNGQFLNARINAFAIHVN